MRLRVLVLFVAFAFVLAPVNAPSRPQDKMPRVELLLSGPEQMPLFYNGRAAKFTAFLVNRSRSPVVFIPPRKEWPEERWTKWQAVDANGRGIHDIPLDLTWCDVHGVMRTQHIEGDQPINTLSDPKQIQDSELVTLQPGEKYEFPDSGDPRFFLKFPKRGKYKINLVYLFQPDHYRLPESSLRTSDLQKAPWLYATSNTLTITLY